MFRNTKSLLIEIAETFVMSFIVIMVLYGLIASIEVVSGASMEPRFHDGERIFVDKISPKIDSYKRGDVVVLIPPNNSSVHYIKRVLGVPGDLVKIFDCNIYVILEGVRYRLEENYLNDNVCTTGGAEVKNGRLFRIPDGYYMALGDNREHSLDSRNLGLIKKSEMVGRVVFRLWPISKIGFTN